MFWFKFFFKDPYFCKPELDSFDTWTVVRDCSQLLNTLLIIPLAYEVCLLLWHTKYVEGYIVFAFPSVHLSVCMLSSVQVLKFYINVLHEVFILIAYIFDSLHLRLLICEQCYLHMIKE